MLQPRSPFRASANTCTSTEMHARNPDTSAQTRLILNAKETWSTAKPTWSSTQPWRTSTQTTAKLMASRRLWSPATGARISTIRNTSRELISTSINPHFHQLPVQKFPRSSSSVSAWRARDSPLQPRRLRLSNLTSSINLADWMRWRWWRIWLDRKGQRSLSSAVSNIWCARNQKYSSPWSFCTRLLLPVGKRLIPMFLTRCSPKRRLALPGPLTPQTVILDLDDYSGSMDLKRSIAVFWMHDFNLPRGLQLPQGVSSVGTFIFRAKHEREGPIDILSSALSSAPHWKAEMLRMHTSIPPHSSPTVDRASLRVFSTSFSV